MTRPRKSSAASEDSTGTAGAQELGSMYDYLAKIILLGPSGTGKSCLLHRFVKNEWRVLSSQTIGVEFATKIIKVGTGARRKRIKLQLWDTAGTERFRSVSRSYYRGAAGAILVYDITSHTTFTNLQPFLNDARALASPNLSLLLVGNKLDLAGDDSLVDTTLPPPTPSSVSASSVPYASTPIQAGSYSSTSTFQGGGGHPGLGSQLRATVAPDGREVSAVEASRWASTVGIPVTMEVSAFSGEGVDEVFGRLARMILTKIELGEIDPDDPMSGIQYGDAGGGWNAGASDGGSIKSTMTGDEGVAMRRRRTKRGGQGGGLREWEEVKSTRRAAMAPRTATPLDKNWTFRQAGTDDPFRPVSQFPTNVHLDLLHHNLIPDPFIGKNEEKVQWVGEAAWVYRVTFPSPSLPHDGGATKAVLVFDGLDTFATVVLNGTTILETDNMFIPERVDISSLLVGDNDENELVITFESAYLEGWKRVEQHPSHKWGVWNGDNSRLAVRKAQYHWGWDWGPALNTCGPWRPITLEVYSGRLADLSFDIDVDKSLSSADVKVTASVEYAPGSADTVRFDITLDGDKVASETVSLKSAEGSDVSASFHVSKPALWYPVRYGKQPLYTVTATLLQKDEVVVDALTKKIGLRRAELVQRPLKDQPGTSFFFEVNNIPLFCGGSDWIPADNFIPRLTPNKYRDWVRLAAEGNQFMLRVWGGGIYEEDSFYSACDEAGILVWQDFMFGCGNYPAWPAMLESIRREARENVRRLRHHPSIVIWAGNNEDYQFQESAGLTYDYADKNPENWLKTDFPARYIYEKILPDICKEMTPRVFYHPGSPWGAGRDTHDPTVGDIHQWNVWHGTQERYQNFDQLVGRFVSEFGMQAFPSTKTIDAYLPGGKDDPDRYAQSSTVDFHNKAEGHERRIALYLVENIRYGPSPLEQFVYATQLVQAECLASAYRLWKRHWKGPDREYCGGALVWQMNDCWPVTSWSIVDFYLRPKMAYFTIKREMAPVSVGITRREHRHPRDKYTRAHVDVEHRVEVWGSNLTLEGLTVDVVLRAWDVETGDKIWEEIHEGVELAENRSTELAAFDVPVRQKGKGEEGRIVVAAYLVGGDGKQIARYVNWPEPLKYLHLQKPKDLKAELAEDASVVRVSAEVPVKGVAVECEDDEVRFEDNLVDIVPGEVVSIGVRGARASTRITTRYLGMLD
ncbi:glycoside hydrolase superfamily [Echria macrotheca]|uniref:Beta-mannosidase B n=1 Tax=Echria macrotheca TaxID=438768 RepID=A0AAJ0B6H5_9PEZI|nr:glycoside hydrolase superfamily [Echria macrotheca]